MGRARETRSVSTLGPPMMPRSNNIFCSTFAIMASDVVVSPECVSVYADLKMGKTIKYIIYTMSKDFTEIIVDKSSNLASYDDFIADLPETECRWAVYNLEYEKDGAGKRNKICFYSWSPDDAKIKQKMLFARSGDLLQRALVGLAVKIIGTDYSEVSYETVWDKASRGA